MVKRILRAYSYPPDLQDTTTRLVLEPAEQIGAGASRTDRHRVDAESAL